MLQDMYESDTGLVEELLPKVPSPEWPKEILCRSTSQ